MTAAKREVFKGSPNISFVHERMPIPEPMNNGAWHLAPWERLWVLPFGYASIVRKAGVHLRYRWYGDTPVARTYATAPWVAMVCWSCSKSRPKVSASRVVAALSEASLDPSYRLAIEGCWYAGGSAAVSAMVEPESHREERCASKRHEASIAIARKRIRRYSRIVYEASRKLEQWRLRLSVITGGANGEVLQDDR